MLAHVEMSWLAPSKLRRTVIVGSEKMLVYEDGTPEPLRIFDSGIEDRRHLRLRRVPALLPDRRHRLPARRRDRADHRRARPTSATRSPTGTEPVSDRRMALDVIRTVEAAEASLARVRPARADRRSRCNPRRPGLEHPDPDRRGSGPRRPPPARSIVRRRAVRGTSEPRSSSGAAGATSSPAASSGRATALSIRFALSRRAAAPDHRDDSWSLLAWTALTLPAWILLLQGLQALRPLHEADQPHGRRRPALALPLAPPRRARVLGAHHVLPVEQMTLLEGAIFGSSALIAILAHAGRMARLARHLFGSETRPHGRHRREHAGCCSARSTSTPSSA